MASISIKSRIGVGDKFVVLATLDYAAAENYATNGVASTLLGLNTITAVFGAKSGAAQYEPYLSGARVLVFDPGSAAEAANGTSMNSGNALSLPLIAIGH